MRSELLIAVVLAAPALAHAETLTSMTVTASSTLAGKHDRYAAWRVLDDDSPDVGAAQPDPGDMGEDAPYHTTSWCEGKADEGVGEWIELAGDDLTFTELDIAAGFWKSDKLFAANNRPTKLHVDVTDHAGKVKGFDLDVPADRQIAMLSPGGAVDATDIKITFVAVAKGKMNDTCVSDIALQNDSDSRTPVLAPAAAAKALESTVSAVDDALSKCDRKAFGALAKFPMSYVTMPANDGSYDSHRYRWKSASAFAKACARGDVPSFGDWDPGWIRQVGPGAVRYRYAGNDVSVGWMQLVYDDAAATWRVAGFTITQ